MMNLVLFGYFVSTQYFANMTDINLKEMIFKKRMQEIEDNVVPFGIIDDGRQYSEQIENTEDPWKIREETQRFIYDPEDPVL